jgi:hypothetical protein
VALIAELETAGFAEREQSSRELGKCDRAVVPLLQRELARRSHLETRLRLIRAIAELTKDDRPFLRAAATGKDRGRVKALVERLGAEDYDEREWATAELRLAAKALLPIFRREVTGNPDLEVRYRLRRIVEEIEARTR